MTTIAIVLIGLTIAATLLLPEFLAFAVDRVLTDDDVVDVSDDRLTVD